MNYDFRKICINTVENYLSKLDTEKSQGWLIWLIPRRRKILYLKYGDFLVRPLIIVGEDDYYIAPSKPVLEYIKHDDSKIVSIVLSVVYDNKHYQIELFKNSRIVFSPKSIGIENVKKLVNYLHHDPDDFVLI